MHVFLVKDISCTVLKSKYPSLTNGHYLINPGEPDFPEFSVHCDMTGKDEIGITEIGHDSENRIEVTGNGGGKPYYGRNITYEFSMDEILAILNQSRYCEQFIKYDCYYSWLLRNGYGWWVPRQGIRMNYWGGAEIESGKCACGMTNTCEGGQPRCNCDAGLCITRNMGQDGDGHAHFDPIWRPNITINCMGVDQNFKF
jgi:hypothetical protein